MRLLVTGSTGLIGSALLDRLRGTHHVFRMVRREPRAGADEIAWNPEAGRIAPPSMEGFDAVIHLAAESLDGFWTAARKRRIYESRVTGTRVLSETLARLETPPLTLICASAVGYYGDRRDEVLTEESSPGRGFLAEVCRDWESASVAAEARGIRVARLRMGVVLSTRGGALPKMITPFRLGLGGKFGSGRQYWSWIVLEDVVNVFLRTLDDNSLAGALNAVAPNPVTNGEFTRALGAALSRPTLFAVPGFAARLFLGEMGNEVLLSSARVVPSRLQAAGFQFRYPTIGEALRALL